MPPPFGIILVVHIIYILGDMEFENLIKSHIQLMV
jgi:hypothetical protein